MKKNLEFWGNEICCASYGFMNTVQDRDINYKLFEATSTVPFGIRHQGERDYSRLLTTYCDPNIGIERAAELWGYRQEKRLFTNSKGAAEYIIERSKTGRCLVGPIDMGRLGYLVMPNLYINMDHYVTVFREEGQIFCMDSEGIPARTLSKEEIRAWFQANELPEAKGNIAVRSFEKIQEKAGNSQEEQAVKRSVGWIRSNLREAGGSTAVEQCFRWLLEKPIERWKLSFLYDISYLIQRKCLQVYWAEYAEKFSVLKRKPVCLLTQTVREQIKLLQKMFRLLQRESRVCEMQFCRLAELENQLTFDIF